MKDTTNSDYGMVSIITATFNSSNKIGETIESIQSQTYPNWELLITDDCSTDNTIEVIGRYASNDNRIKVFKSIKNGGPGIARNNSIKHAKGRYIAFCDSDDRWIPNKLEKQLKFMVGKDCGLSYSSYFTSSSEGEINGIVKCLPNLNKSKILRDNGVGCLTAIYDAKKIGKHFMPSIRKRQDWCLWIEIIREFGTAYGLQEPLAIYRDSKGSVSSGKLSLLKYNFDVYNKFLGYNKPISAILLTGYFMPYYIFKKIKQKIDSNKVKKSK